MSVRYEMNTAILNKIPGSPLAYWVGKKFGDIYDHKKIGNVAEVITGMTIGDNNKYLRLWFEVENKKLALNKNSMKDINITVQNWIPYSKGGERTNWYGGYDYVVNWKEKEKFNRSKTTLQYLYLKEALTWPFISGSKLTAKLLPVGFLWDVAGSPCFFNDKTYEYYVLAFLTTPVSNYILNIVNPTINVQAIDIARLPIIECNDINFVVLKVKDNIEISAIDWNDNEISWDFKKHPPI